MFHCNGQGQHTHFARTKTLQDRQHIALYLFINLTKSYCITILKIFSPECCHDSTIVFQFSVTLQALVLHEGVSLNLEYKGELKLSWPHLLYHPEEGTQLFNIFSCTSTKPSPGNLGSWFSVCNLILTQLERWPQKNGRLTQKKY